MMGTRSKSEFTALSLDEKSAALRLHSWLPVLSRRVAITVVLLAAALVSASCVRGAPDIPTATTIPTVAAAPLPAPTILGLGTVSSGLPRSLIWQTYPDPETKFELQWRFQDVGIWQDMGEAPAGATQFGEGSGILAFKGNFATYCYRIRAVKGESSSAWSEESCARIGAGEPSEHFRWAPPVYGPEVTRGPEGTMVSWNPTDISFRDKLSFEVWRRNRHSPVYETVATVSGFEGGFLDPAGTANSCYRIRAVLEGIPSISPESCLAVPE